MNRPDDNLAVVAASPRTVTLDGVDYRVAKITPRILGHLQAFLMDAVPDPRSRVRPMMDGLPDAVAIHLWNMASTEAKSWPPKLDDPEGLSILTSPNGMVRVVELVIGPGLAGFDRKQAEALVDRMTMEDFMGILQLAMPGDPHAPKAVATGAAPSPGAN